MNKGEINAARNILACNGRMTGTRSGMLRTLGFNGSWAEFESAFSPFMHTDPKHPKMITLTDPSWKETIDSPARIHLDPKKYAEAATNFVLGDEAQQSITQFFGNYGEHQEVIGHLGASICESICRIYYPQQTDRIVMYQAERTLLYRATAGTFMIYGE